MQNYSCLIEGIDGSFQTFDNHFILTSIRGPRINMAFWSLILHRACKFSMISWSKFSAVSSKYLPVLNVR